jgi:hypothetical protein
MCKILRVVPEKNISEIDGKIVCSIFSSISFRNEKGKIIKIACIRFVPVCLLCNF